MSRIKWHIHGTPGPWKTTEDKTSPGFFITRAANGKQICVSQQRNSEMGRSTDPSRRATLVNTRAIDLVPEMVEMLRKAQNALYHAGDSATFQAVTDLLLDVDYPPPAPPGIKTCKRCLTAHVRRKCPICFGGVS